jgi:hypothetical protein
MRRVLAAASLFSLIGAIVLGGAAAWSTSLVIPGLTSTVGVADVQLAALGYEPTGETIGPPDGIYATVGRGFLDNVGDFDLEWDDGSVVLKEYVPGPTSGPGLCLLSNFLTVLQPAGRWGAQLEVPPDDEVLGYTNDPAFWVFVGVAPTAPAACQGGVLHYDIFVRARSASR